VQTFFLRITLVADTTSKWRTNNTLLI